VTSGDRRPSVVEVQLLSGHAHRVRSIVEITPGSVTLETYQPKGDLTHERLVSGRNRAREVTRHVPMRHRVREHRGGRVRSVAVAGPRTSGLRQRVSTAPPVDDPGRVVVVSAGFALWKGRAMHLGCRWSDIRRLRAYRASDALASW